MAKRYFIELCYRGTNYHGWQIQPNAPTVQETLERAMSVLFREKIEVTGAGRTDTGVHALHFVAHFDCVLDLEENHYTWVHKLNALLPHDIAVYRINRVPDDAHARFDARSRTYLYRITLLKDPFLHDFAYFLKYPLDVEKMNLACKTLFEYTDFTSFSKLHTDVKTNNCVISQAFWEKDIDQLNFTITADRFLRNMVRAIVGTCIDVGRGKIAVEEMESIIKKKDRSAAGKSVPAHGLYLKRIEYGTVDHH